MPPLLEVRGLCKAYPGVKALDRVDFTLRAGEVHALLGENGAGKSTLIGILTGAIARDAGLVRLEGRETHPRSPAEAQALGLCAVYQEVNLLPNLSVAENLYLGRQPTRFGLLRRREMNRRARALLSAYGLSIDVSRGLGSYSTAIQQIIAIARAVDLSARILGLDEPTSSLDSHESAMLFEVIRALRTRGLGIVFVTHFLDQVYAVSDRITVLRNGRVAGVSDTATLPKIELVSLMLGKAQAAEMRSERRKSESIGKPVAGFHGLGRRGLVEPFDLELRAGEIVGAAGLLGSGRTETALLMFGAEASDRGEVVVEGRKVALKSPRDAIRLGFGLCPEDRKRDGIIGALSIRENIALALQAKTGWLRKLSRKTQEALAAHYIRLLDIRTTDAEKPIDQLSGGNQQKALLARWLATTPLLLLLDEPTRGIDVGAHAEIVRLTETLRDSGMALYVVSSEIDEILAYSDRVLVMRDRRAVGMLEGSTVTAQAIVSAIAGKEAA
jgi:galactofuranose transport system ATP-binding protein